MNSDAFWIVVLLLVLFIEPLRDSVWNILLGADPLLLVLLFVIVWYWGSKR